MMSEVAPLVPPSLLDRAATFLRDSAYLFVDERCRQDLERGLSQAAQAYGVTVEELVLALDGGGRVDSEAARQELIRAATVGETYFGRHAEPLAVAINHAAARASGRVLKLWSAGCSSGEEAYTLAALTENVRSEDYAVLATDIRKSALQQAAAGSYTAWSVRAAPPPWLSRWLEPRTDGGFVVSHALRRNVVFRYLNLCDPAYPSPVTLTDGLDLIVCRNVLIYFTPDARRNVVSRMLRCLLPGGLLLLGAGELSPALAELGSTVDIGGQTFLSPATQAPQSQERRPPPASRAAKATEAPRRCAACSKECRLSSLLASTSVERGAQALEQLERMLFEQPLHLDAHLARADLLERLGRFSEARREWQTVVRLAAQRSAERCTEGPSPQWCGAVAQSRISLAPEGAPHG